VDAGCGLRINEFQIAVNQGAVNMVIGLEMQMWESFTGNLLKLIGSRHDMTLKR